LSTVFFRARFKFNSKLNFDSSQSQWGLKAA
jgi:hypothetical protein